ncbi:MAG: T9SS type A sorting domain-containing protein [Ignavibacteria bacterium]
MKKLLIVLLIFFWGKADVLFSQQLYTPADFNLSIFRGNIDKSKMSSSQKDTILIDTYNYEDNFFDIAILYRSENEIRIYKNCVNGFLTEYKKIEFSKDKPAYKIENDSPTEKVILFNPNLRSGIKIIYRDNSVEKIPNYKINNAFNEPEYKIPLWNFLDAAGVFVYDISFIEVWRSMRNGTPARELPIGDIDRDGKNEMVFTFWPVNDTMPQNFPTRMVVFEAMGNDQYRIDWDTIFTQGGYNDLQYVTDFDRDGNYEFFGAGWDVFGGGFNNGIFECTGPGKYKFRDYGGCLCGGLEDVVVIDTTHLNINQGNSGMWIVNAGSGGPSRIQLKVFNQKNQYYYHFQSVFNANDIQLQQYVYDIDAADIDNDGKMEVLIGDTQFGTNYIGYLDSTGAGSPLMQGYEYKEITPNAPISSGWLLLKDFDGDNKKEIITCGIGNGSGSIGVVKNFGGENFQTMWWDTAGIVAGPNYRIDSNFIVNQFSILYPCVRYSGPLDWLNLITYSKGDVYSFYKSSFRIIDSAAFLGPRLYDIDNDDKVNIIGGYFTDGPPNWKSYIVDFEQQGTIGIENLNSEIPETFTLYQNYPNPFNGQTKIKFDLKVSGLYKLKLFDISGKEIQTIVNEFLNYGSYNINFNAGDLSSGVYFYNLSSIKFNQTKKLILIK